MKWIWAFFILSDLKVKSQDPSDMLEYHLRHSLLLITILCVVEMPSDLWNITIFWCFEKLVCIRSKIRSSVYQLRCILYESYHTSTSTSALSVLLSWGKKQDHQYFRKQFSFWPTDEWTSRPADGLSTHCILNWAEYIYNMYSIWASLSCGDSESHNRKRVEEKDRALLGNDPGLDLNLGPHFTATLNPFTHYSRFRRTVLIQLGVINIQESWRGVDGAV